MSLLPLVPTDPEIRNCADILGDWVARDITLHIPVDAAVDHEAQGAWVTCKLFVPLPFALPHD